MAADQEPQAADQIEIRRSRKRRRTVTAYREHGRIIVLMPAGLSPDEEAGWVQTMIRRLAAQDRRRTPGDAELRRRAAELSQRYFGGQAQPTAVSWAANQNSRWGSCTPADGTIRISIRVQGLPSYVLDYVLLHELAHLLEPSHGPAFWALLASYPRTERARGYLEGLSRASRLSPDIPANPAESVGEVGDDPAGQCS